MREDGKLSPLGLEVMACPAADRARWRLNFEWLNIIVLMGGLRNEYLNHVKRAVAQLPAGYAWDEVRETASVQQDHESNRHTRANSFGKGGQVNYAGQRGRSGSTAPRGGEAEAAEVPAEAAVATVPERRSSIGEKSHP